jgi:lipoprotein signal peptidase
MEISNPSKALIALVGLICITVLMATRAIDQTTGMPVLTLIIGYAVGNGIAAKQGQQVSPIIGMRHGSEEN